MTHFNTTDEIEEALSELQTFATLHTWEVDKQLNQTADCYFDLVEPAGWSKARFRNYFAHCSAEEQLKIHGELNLVYADDLRVTREEVKRLDRLCNTTRVAGDLFAKAVVLLPRDLSKRLLEEVEGGEELEHAEDEVREERKLVGDNVEETAVLQDAKINGDGVEGRDGACVRARRRRGVRGKRRHSKQNVDDGQTTSESLEEEATTEEEKPNKTETTNATPEQAIGGLPETACRSYRKRSLTSIHDPADAVEEHQNKKSKTGKNNEPVSLKLVVDPVPTEAGASTISMEVDGLELSPGTEPEETLQHLFNNTTTESASVNTVSIALTSPVKKSENPLQDISDSSLSSAKTSPLSSPPSTPPPKKSSTKSPFFTPTSSAKKKLGRVPAGVSCNPVPPLSAPIFGIAQERLANDPFRLLIAVQFLNKTRGSVAMPVCRDLMTTFPTPEALAAANIKDIVPRIRHLGLQNQRAAKIIAIAKTWLAQPPEKGKRYRTLHYPRPDDGKDIRPDEILSDEDERQGAWEIAHIPGCGDYAIDSWRIFCRDKLRGVASGYNGERPHGLELLSNANPTTSGAQAIANALADEDEEAYEPEWRRVLPRDKELRAFLRWMWLKQGWVWDPLTGERTCATKELLEEAEKGDLAWREQQEGLLLVKTPTDATGEATGVHSGVKINAKVTGATVVPVPINALIKNENDDEGNEVKPTTPKAKSTNKVLQPVFTTDMTPRRWSSRLQAQKETTSAENSPTPSTVDHSKDNVFGVNVDVTGTPSGRSRSTKQSTT